MIQSYRLVFTDADSGATRELTFADSSADRAFNLACTARGETAVQIFADDRLLGHLKRSPAGFWTLS